MLRKSIQGWEIGNCDQVFGKSSDGSFTIRYSVAGDFVSTTGSVNVDMYDIILLHLFSEHSPSFSINCLS